MNHIQILYFLAVARCLSFSEAARQLFVAQSAISKQIQTLEKTLGIKLFIRTNRNVELTPAGEVMYRELQKYNNWINQIIDMVDQVDKGKAGSLNIGILHGVDLPVERIRELSQFVVENSDIQVNLQRVKLDEVNSVLDMGTHDVIVSYSFLTPDYHNIDMAVLEEEEDCIVVSKNHPIGREKNILKDHLRNYPLVTISPEVSRYAYLNSLNYLTGIGVSPQKINHVPTIEDIYLSVEFDLGYGIGSVSSRLSRNQEAFRLVDMYGKEGLKAPRTDIVAIWRNDIVNSSVKSFSEYLENQMKVKMRKTEQ